MIKKIEITFEDDKTDIEKRLASLEALIEVLKAKELAVKYDCMSKVARGCASNSNCDLWLGKI